MLDLRTELKEALKNKNFHVIEASSLSLYPTYFLETTIISSKFEELLRQWTLDVKGMVFDVTLKRGQVPQQFKANLHQVLRHLRSSGYVFGDLRPPNVIVTPERKFTVRLIDFDWAGREGEVEYPISISKSIDWPEGVQGLEHIQWQHDLDMFQSLISQCA